MFEETVTLRGEREREPLESPCGKYCGLLVALGVASLYKFDPRPIVRLPIPPMARYVPVRPVGTALAMNIWSKLLWLGKHQRTRPKKRDTTMCHCRRYIA